MPSNTMRLKCDSSNLTPTIYDENTGITPGYFRGSDVSLELLLAESGLPVPTSDFASVTVSLRPLTSDNENLSFWSRTLVPVDLNPIASNLTTALSAWEAGGAGQVNGFRIPAAVAALPAGVYRLHVEGRGIDDSLGVYLSAQFAVVNPAGATGDDMGALVLALSGTIMAEASAAAAAAQQAAADAASAAADAAAAAANVAAINAAVANIATQAEAEAGSANNRMMTPLRVAQQIAANAGVVHRNGNESIAGAKTFTTGVTAQALTSNTPIISAQPATEDPQVPNYGQIKELLGSKFALSSDFPNISGITPGATKADSSVDGLQFVFGTGLASWKSKYCWKSITASGDWQATARVKHQFRRQSGIAFGIALISSTANVVATIGYRSGTSFSILRANATTGALTSTLQAETDCSGLDNWVRVKFISATNTYEVYLSRDGSYWWKMGEWTVATVFGGTGGANKADRIGIGIMTDETSGKTIAVSVPYWDSDA
jgi:hypothetical protein